MSIEPQQPAAGWRCVAAGAVVTVFGAQVMFGSTFGLVLAPVLAESGWSRTEFYFGVSIMAASSPLIAPAIGWLVDRYGSRRVMLPSLAAQALVLVGLAAMQSLWQYYVLCVLLFAFSSGSAAIPLAKAINGWFAAAPGWPLGVCFSLGTLGAVIHPLLGHQLLVASGWRAMYLAQAAAVGLLALLAAWAWMHESEAAASDPPAGEKKGRKAQSMTTGSLLRSADLWRLMVWCVCAMFGLAALQGHLVPILTEHDVSAGRAAGAQSLVGVGLLMGNALFGWLLDRTDPRRLASLMFLLPLGAIALLASGISVATAVPLLLGTAAGADTVILMYLCGRYFGAAVYARAVSFLLISVAVGAASGPAVLAALRDASGTYETGMLACGAAFVLALLIPVLLFKPLHR